MSPHSSWTSRLTLPIFKDKRRTSTSSSSSSPSPTPLPSPGSTLATPSTNFDPLATTVITKQTLDTAEDHNRSGDRRHSHTRSRSSRGSLQDESHDHFQSAPNGSLYKQIQHSHKYLQPVTHQHKHPPGYSQGYIRPAGIVRSNPSYKEAKSPRTSIQGTVDAGDF